MNKSISIENLKDALSQNNEKFNGVISELDEVISDINLRSMIGKKLDYICVKPSSTQVIASNDIVKFDDIMASNNMELDNLNHAIKLNKGVTYEISVGIYCYDKSDFIQAGVYDITSNKLVSFITTASPTHSTVHNTPSPFATVIYKSDQDCWIQTKILTANGSTLNYDGTYLMAKEIGRTHIVDPMNVKDEHKVEYLSATLADRQTLIAEGYIQFDTIVNSNIKSKISLNPLSGICTLQAGTYKIDADVYLITNSSFCVFALYDVLNTYTYPTGSVAMSSNYNDPRSSNQISTIITLNKETQLAIRIASVGGTPIAYGSGCTKLNIQEIAQPVVVEYTNHTEISNPLTNGELSQETPVGSVMSFYGTIAPRHYLFCDGAIYNIDDYPYLAKHIEAEYGKINSFGGDGITTFGVPNDDLLTIEKISPTMTSNTSPSPYVASASTSYDSNLQPWKLFDEKAGDNDGWVSSNGDLGWVKIDLGSTKLVNRFSLEVSANTTTPPKDFTFEGSLDGSTFVELGAFSVSNWTPSEIRHFKVNNSRAYRYYRISIKSNNGFERTGIREWSLYKSSNIVNCIKYEPTHIAVNQYGGFESEVLFEGNANAIGDYMLTNSIKNHNFLLVETNSIRVIPSVKTLLSPTNMTSNVLPAPYVITESSYVNSNGGWKAFSDSYWRVADNKATGWLQIDLGTPQLINYFEIGAISSNALPLTNCPKDFTLQGSNDGINFVILGSFADITGWVSLTHKSFSILNDTAYRYYKLDITANNGGTLGTAVRAFKLYNGIDEKHEIIKENQIIKVNSQINNNFYTVNQWNSNATYTSRVEFSFKNDNEFNVSEVYHRGYGGVYISQITGTSGSFPTLIKGGTA